MKFLTPNANEPISCPACHQFGEILWHLLKAAQMIEGRKREQKEFGHEVGLDEIHWWIFNKEDDLDSLRTRSESTLEAAENLKNESVQLTKVHPRSYLALLTSLRTFAETHQASTQKILDYLRWLSERNPLAPSILFAYRVWGTTRRSDRWIIVSGDKPQEENQDAKQSLTETALGLRMVQGKLPTFDYVLLEAYDDWDESAGEIPETEIALRTSWRVLGDFVSFLTEIRNSLRNILLEIGKCTAQRSVMHSDAFWRKFIVASARSAKSETQVWDFKETLTIWHTRNEVKEKAKVTLAEDVAALANADGGVLIVGVSNDRRIVGLDGDIESRLKTVSDTLSERLEYPRRIFELHQVGVPDETGVSKLCLVIIVAKAMEPVGVSDGDGRYTYPIRRETGLTRTSRDSIVGVKLHEKSDSRDFLSALEHFVRDSET